MDRNRFIWIRDDSVSPINRLGNPSDILLNHYYKQLDSNDMIYEEGYLMTKKGDVYEYSVEHATSHPTLEEKINSAMWIGSLTQKDQAKALHSVLDSHTTIKHKKKKKKKKKKKTNSTGLQQNESEFLIGYHTDQLPRIMYGLHGDSTYHCDSDLIDLYNAFEWHEEM